MYFEFDQMKKIHLDKINTSYTSRILEKHAKNEMTTEKRCGLKG